MSDTVDRIRQIIEWHVLHAGEAEVSDCVAAAEEICQLLADPDMPTQPERFADEEAKRAAEQAAFGSREDRLVRALKP